MSGNGIKGSFSIGPRAGAALISAAIAGLAALANQMGAPASAADMKEIQTRLEGATQQAAAVSAAMSEHAVFDAQRDLDRREKEREQDARLNKVDEKLDRLIEALSATNQRLERIAGQLESRGGSRGGR